MNIEILRKLKALENPETVGEIKGNEKVLFAKRKNVIILVFYPKTIQYDKVVDYNSNDYEYLDEQGVKDYLTTKGIDINDIEVPKIDDSKNSITQDKIELINKAEEIMINNSDVINKNNDVVSINESKEEIIPTKKKGGRPSKK